MDQDVKPLVGCCIGCLQHDVRVHKEEAVNDEVIKVYKSLVIDEISQLDSNPLQLCGSCIETLQSIVTFRKQCLSSIRYLNGSMQFNFVYVENEAENVDDVEIKQEEFYDDAPLLPLKVEIEKGPKKLYGLRTNRKAKIEPPVLPLKRKKEKRDVKKIQKEKKQTSAYCSICGEFYQRNLVKHITTVHTMQIEDGQYKCNLCEEICKDLSVILEHFDKHRDYQEAKMCNVCDLLFKNRREYRLHVKSHNEKKRVRVARQYRCDCCEAIYVSPTNLKYHMMSKHQGAMQCNYCNKAFFDMESYEKHIKMEKEKINARKFFCDHCGYECKWKAALWLHMKKYHNPDEPSIICNDCGKSYKTKTQFRSHQMTSHLEKSHQCSNCGKKFAFATTLRKHIRLYHTEEGMFQECKVCGKKLKTSSMRIHMSSVHQQLRKHKCDLCDMVFKTTGTLTKHKYSHSKTRPFNCNLCPTGYYQNEYLRKHFERVHGIVYSKADIRKICGMQNRDYLAEKERAEQEVRS